MTPLSLRTLVLLLVAASAPAASALAAADPPRTAQIPATMPDPRLGEAEAAEIQGLFDEARAVLASAEFEANLVATTRGLDLRLKPEGETISGAELARMVRGEHPGTTYLPALVRWRSLFWGTETEARDEPPFGPVIKVKGAVRGLWRSRDPLRRSCPINTAAHELTHTLTRTPGEIDWTIADKDYEDAPATQHFASYTVGSVAQCTWLQRRKELKVPVEACIEENGTRDYSPAHC